MGALRSNAVGGLYTRKFDPGTRDVVMQGATWAGDSPSLALVLRTLSIFEGECPLQPDLGLRRDAFRSVYAGAESRIEAEILRALRSLEQRQIIDGISVRAEAQRGKALAELSFVDVRSQRRSRLSGVLTT
jgi:phage baseplate assembly protein W